MHVDGSVDPIRDKETIDVELQLKDLEAVEKRLDKVKRAAKTGNKEAQKEEERRIADEAVALLAAQKAARDAKYAARKARKGKKSRSR